MKKIINKSPLKRLTDAEKKAQEKKSNSTTVVKGAKPGYGAIVSQSNSSKAAGAQLVTKKITPAKPAETKTVYTPPKHTAAGDKAYANMTQAEKNAADARYRRKNTKKVIVKPAEDEKIEDEAPQNNASDNSSDLNSTKVEETQKQGTTAIDVRGDNRKIKVAIRESANAAKNIAKFEEKAKNTTNLKKKAKFEAKAAGNKTKLQYNQEVLGHAEEAGRQGSTGNRMVTTSKDISNARITAQNKDLIDGGNSQSSFNNDFSAPKVTDAAIVEPAKTTGTTSPKAASIDDVKASAKAADTEMQKRYAKKDGAKKDGATSRGAVEIDHEGLQKSSSAAKMVKSSVLKMFKPGSFKMGGFGSKSKK